MENATAITQYSSATQCWTPEVMHFLETSARYLELPLATTQPQSGNRVYPS